ncbi:hypothetical protein GGF31_002052 [Allomyces arbusculus]|nr:hypothetical protein GGF31_002052 [Allomyces arbusculus]
MPASNEPSDNKAAVIGARSLQAHGSVSDKQLARDQDHKIERAVAPVTTLADKADPLPHYVMASACGIGAWVAHAMHGNPRSAAIAGACAVGYAYAGMLIGEGRTKMGYDVGTLASVGITAATGRRAWEKGDQWATALASLGAISTVGNVAKAWQERTGHPQNLDL